MLVFKQWFWWPAVAVGVGIGLFAFGLVLGQIHPGTLSIAPLSFSSGAPVTLEAKLWSDGPIEVWLDVNELSPDEPNLSSLKPPLVKLMVVGGELRQRDYESPSSFRQSGVGFELAQIDAKPGNLVKVTAIPNPASSAFDVRKPVLKLHEWHPTWSGFFIIASSANCLGIPLFLIGLGVLVSRWSKQPKTG